MVRPDYKEFSRLAREATLIPVTKSVTADLQTPVSAFLAIAGRERRAFLLESVEGGEKIGRYTFLGARPYMVVTARGRQITIERGRERRRFEGSVFEVLRDLLGQHRPAHVEGLPPFTSGAVGFFAYDVVRQLEKLPSKARVDTRVPDCVMMFFDRLLAFDHLRHQIHLIAAADLTHESPRAAYDRAVRDLAAFEKRLTTGTRARRVRQARRPGPLKIEPVTSRQQYLESVRRAKEYIAAGDIFQVVLSQRFDFEPGAEPFNIYRALRTVNPSPYLYFLRIDDTHILGSSPEMLVRVNGRRL